MFAISSKSVASKTVPIPSIRRFLTSTSHRHAAKTSSSTKTSTGEQSKSSATEKSVESYRPLTEDEIQRIVNLDNIHLTTRFQQKCPQRPPLLRNFFTTTIDREMLTYPQIFDCKEFDAMQEKMSLITDYFTNNRRTPAVLRFRDISNNMAADFRVMKLFGLSAPERFAGSGFFKCEMTWASECESNDLKSFLMLAGHRLVIEAITDHGDEFQHNQYLMDMAKGDVIGAVCIPDPLSKNGSITVTKSDKEFILNGTASWVVRSQHANLLLVVANKSEDFKKAEENEDYDDPALTFILDANSHGITYEDKAESIGLNLVPFTTVKFTNVRARKSELLSQVLDDRQTSKKLLASARLQHSVLNMGQSKLILNHLIDNAVRTKCNGEKLRDQQFVLADLAEAAMNIYALESMIYLTNGILDIYDNPKTDLESAATKAFSKDTLKSVAQIALKKFGTSITIHGHELEQDIRNAFQLQTLEGTSDALKRYVALNGIKHCDTFGKNVDDYQDSFFVKWGLADPTIQCIEPKQRLGDFLHPNFEQSADNIEESIRRLQCASEMFLYRHGEEVAAHSNDLNTIGDIAVGNYAMFASVSRASRSYCLGIRYAQYETIAAANFTFRISRRIMNTVLGMKHRENEMQKTQKEAIESSLDLRRRGYSPFASVAKSGVMAKTDKSN